MSGATCTAIDNCATNNGGCVTTNAVCADTGPGANSCTCNQGYSGDGTASCGCAIGEKLNADGLSCSTASQIDLYNDGQAKYFIDNGNVAPFSALSTTPLAVTLAAVSGGYTLTTVEATPRRLCVLVIATDTYEVQWAALRQVAVSRTGRALGASGN